MKMVFLMDPLEGVIFEKDTSFAMMRGANARGHEVYFLPEGQISAGTQGVRMHVQRVTPQDSPSAPFIRHEWDDLHADELGAVFIRTDPPFDAEYLMQTWLLDRLPARVPVVNDPSGIRTVNEKVWALQFADLLPRTIVSRDADVLRAFLAEEGKAIAKPTDGFGGQSVFVLRDGDTNAAVAIETLSGHGQREIIVQQYVPEAGEGDKRILLLNGEILGAVLRVHGEDDHRNNFFAGGKPVATEITARDREVVAALAPKLRELGLSFVGIDMLGDYLIEVNVTSPTCLQEMNRIQDVLLEEQVIAFVEELAAQRAGQD